LIDDAVLDTHASQEPAPPAHQVYTSLMAHELRTPVTSIFGYLQLLADDRLLDDLIRLRRYLSMVRGRAAELARIVSELTTFSDVLAGTAPGRGQDVSATSPDGGMNALFPASAAVE
jgi:signal transduction histidine kinase